MEAIVWPRPVGTDLLLGLGLTYMFEASFFAVLRFQADEDMPIPCRVL